MEVFEEIDAQFAHKGQSLLKNGQDQKVHGPRLDDCIERFSASRKEELGEKTAAAYRFQLSLDRLRAYCAALNVGFQMHTRVLKWFVESDHPVNAEPAVGSEPFIARDC